MYARMTARNQIRLQLLWYNATYAFAKVYVALKKMHKKTASSKEKAVCKMYAGFI